MISAEALNIKHPLIPIEECSYLLAEVRHQDPAALWLLEFILKSENDLTINKLDIYLRLNAFVTVQGTTEHTLQNTVLFDEIGEKNLMDRLETDDMHETPDVIFRAREWRHLFGFVSTYDENKLMVFVDEYKKALRLLMPDHPESDDDYLIAISSLGNWYLSELFIKLARLDGPTQLATLCHLICILACQQQNMRKARKNPYPLSYLEVAEVIIARFTQNPNDTTLLGQIVWDHFKRKEE